MAKRMIRIVYWHGQQQFTGWANTYAGAMRIASKNRNAFGPRFYDRRNVELHDDGNGLAYADPDSNGRRLYAV